MQLSLSHTFPPHRPSCHAALVMDRFGIGPETTRHVIADNLELPLQPGDIACFLGPSGSGKSSLLRAAAGELQDAIWLDRLDLGDALVIDGLGLPADAAFELLTRCGLGERRIRVWTPWIRTAADSRAFAQAFFATYAAPSMNYELDVPDRDELVKPWEGARLSSRSPKAAGDSAPARRSSSQRCRR